MRTCTCRRKGARPSMERLLRLRHVRAASLSGGVFLSACMSPPPVTTSPEVSGEYEVSGAIYRADFFAGARYLEQERDARGLIRLEGGQPVPLTLVFMDAAGVDPKIVVSRVDGTAMGVLDEAVALRVAAVLCADKARRPVGRAGNNNTVPPATSVLEDGKWGVFNLCR